MTNGGRLCALGDLVEGDRMVLDGTDLVGGSRNRLDPGAVWAVLSKRERDDGTVVIEIAGPDGSRRHVSPRSGGSYVRVIGEHHAVCATCREPWPCSHDRRESAVRSYAYHLKTACVVCGKTDGSRWAEVKVRRDGGDDLAVERYHVRKGSSCRRRYIEAITGNDEALALLEQMDDLYRPTR